MSEAWLQCNRYREIFEMYKKAVASFWTVEEVDLSQDMRDWERLSGPPRPDQQEVTCCLST